MKKKTKSVKTEKKQRKKQAKRQSKAKTQQSGYDVVSGTIYQPGSYDGVVITVGNERGILRRDEYVLHPALFWKEMILGCWSEDCDILPEKADGVTLCSTRRDFVKAAKNSPVLYFIGDKYGFLKAGQHYGIENSIGGIAFKTVVSPRYSETVLRQAAEELEAWYGGGYIRWEYERNCDCCGSWVVQERGGSFCGDDYLMRIAEDVKTMNCSSLDLTSALFDYAEKNK